MAGVNYVFTSSREACDNCGMQDDENLKISGTKVITPMLMDYIKIGKLQDLTPANVVPFLIQNLKWRIVDVSPSQITKSCLPFAKVRLLT